MTVDCHEIDIGADDRIIVIGAGIIGASIAYHLALRGVDVLVIDRHGPAAGATGKSFAWINANHVADEAYHRFRYQSLFEYHRLDRELNGALGIQWGGALCFDLGDDMFDQRQASFRALGYPAETVSDNAFRNLEPHYREAPKRALRLALEGSMDPIQGCAALIKAAADLGARFMYGPDVLGFQRNGDDLVGIETSHGAFRARHAVVAAGIGTADLLAAAGFCLPMANRPGILLHSQPLHQVLNHVVWGDRIHLKQQDDGRLVIGEIFSDSEVDLDQMTIIGSMLQEARRHLADLDINIDKITVGMRPIPGDGRPAIGPAVPIQGIYIAVMHSGVTLAPIVGRMVAEELLDGVAFAMLETYRPARFA